MIARLKTIVISSMLISCGGPNSETAAIPEKYTTTSHDESSEAPQQEEFFISDTIASFKVDDYPVLNDMFIDKINPWFRNDTLNQTLVFDLYTDYHRMYTYHFYTKDIPSDLLKIMERNFNGGELEDEMVKSEFLRKNLNQSTKISMHYFTTNKGIQLGDPKRKLLSIYGKPDRKSIRNGVEKLEWNFVGEAIYDGEADLENKPLAEHSFGHEIVMYFKNERLVGQIFFNAAP